MTLMEVDPALLNMIVMIGLLFVMMYFLIIRPGKKRASEQQQLMSALAPGARIMLTSGLFGTIKYIGEKQAVVELAPGLEVTVVKPAIARTLKEDEEEFEYEDDAPTEDAPATGDPVDEQEFFSGQADQSTEPDADSGPTSEPTFADPAGTEPSEPLRGTEK